MTLLELARDYIADVRAKVATGEVTELCAVNAAMAVVGYLEVLEAHRLSPNTDTLEIIAGRLTAKLAVPTYGSEVLCPVCAETFCPHKDALHFHHDGCPSCEPEPTDTLKAFDELLGVDGEKPR